MNQNQATPNSQSKFTTISSISSNIPLIDTNKNIDTTHPKRPSMNSTIDVDSFLNSIKTNQNRDSTKRNRAVCQPPGTTSYTVNNNDTLEKVALHFNLTPCELIHLNKLNTRTVFPGQILFVPETSLTITSDSHKSTTAITKSTDESSSSNTRATNQQTIPIPGHAQRLKSETSMESDSSSSSSSQTIENRLKSKKKDNMKQVEHLQKTLSIEENQQIDDECLQRFIKVNVRLMTEDYTNVAGTLLVTPNAVMFDPDVLDPLVKEYGIEKYGLIIQMNILAGIALYEDIAVYEHETTLKEEEKRRMCHSISLKSFEQEKQVVLNNDDESIHELMSWLLDKIDRETIDSSTMLFDISSITHQSKEIQHRLDDNIEPKHSASVLIDETDTNIQGYHFENCVPIDDFNKRFDEIDKLLQKQHDIYVTPHPIEIPYYLCIKTSAFKDDIVFAHDRNRKYIDNAYGKKELEHEYWFSVPKEKVDHVYAFFLRWSPEGTIDSSSNDDHHDIIAGNSKTKTNRQFDQTQILAGHGFVLLANDDPELTDDYVKSNDKNLSKSQTLVTSCDKNVRPKSQHYLKRQNTLLKEWEIISVDEIYRRINATHATTKVLSNFNVPPPKLLQPSTLIDEEQTIRILLESPARVHGLNWQIIFSTETHGFSLAQLYRRSMEIDQDAPSLLIVKDTDKNLFGAYISQQLMISEGFYGTGESFLFTFHPHFQAFHWSGNNQFFVKGDAKSLGIGCGEGTYGLWVDADLYRGRTCPSKTFDNVRLSSKEDFIIANIELWTFVD